MLRPDPAAAPRSLLSSYIRIATGTVDDILSRASSAHRSTLGRAGSPRTGTVSYLLALLASTLCLAPSAAAQQEAGTVGPTLPAARLQGELEIDGRPVEEAWNRAPVATDFVQGDPTEGAPPARPTEVRVLYDAEAIYVAARMHEEDPSEIADQLVRRDERGQYDYFELSLDPNLDQQTGYVFRVGVSGVERDAYVTGGGSGRGGQGVNWNAVWESATHVDASGWTVEMRIPLSQIRFESRPGEQQWGINFTRRRLASSSTSFWSLESRTVQGSVNQWGRLTDLRFREAARRFEIQPYVVSQLSSRPVDAGNPLAESTEFSPRVGGDLSYGVGSAFTLDATVNPDFGQVEVDPAVINLSAFETFFPEKRPFFVQDAQVFSFDMSGRRSRLFFSRRIGREPHGDSPEDAAYASVPDRTTILGASKFTGRTQGGLSVGGLAALTGQEHGRAYYSDTGTTRKFLVEPTTEYGVGRVQQDFRGGATTVGAIVTGVNRHLPSDGRLDELTDRAFSGGMDFNHQWGGSNDRRWSLEGYYAATHVQGSREAILDIQTNPQHYFQRPDAEKVEVDSARTQMTGSNWRLEFNRQSAEHWTWGVWVAEITPDFAANDIGFNSDGARLDGGARVRYQDITPGPVFRNWGVSAFMYHNARHTLLDAPFSGDQWANSYESGTFNVDFRGELHNNWWVSPELGYSPQAMSDTETRGGPLMTTPSERQIGLRFGTDRRERVSLEPNISYTSLGLDAGRSWQLSTELSVRPSSNWEIQLEPEFRDETNAAQYVTTDENSGFGSTYGDRYLFADLERTQLSMQTRLNVAFSPELSLQLFAQPLISAVSFNGIKQLAEPASYRFDRFQEGTPVVSRGELSCTSETGAAPRTCLYQGERYLDYDGDGEPDYSFDEQDFNFRSMRGNAVLRWEYMPGSILFLVWQHDRQDRESVGDFDFGRDVDSLFGAESENRFIVKLSHFLDL